MVINMKAKIKATYNLILPDKKINYFVIILIAVGFITGAFFLTLISSSEKATITDQITNFITSINNQTLDNLSIFKNSLFSNLILILIIWLLGLSIIGIILNIFLIYLKGFVLGFTISSIILSYKAKGLLFSLIYIFPNELLKIIILLILGVYSLTLSLNIIKELLKKNNNNLRTIFKRYFIIIIICLILSLLSSLYESFVLPNLLNVIY